MAIFMLKENRVICVDDVTEFSTEGDYIFAWNDDIRVAAFKASEIIGCWLERKTVLVDGKVY